MINSKFIKKIYEKSLLFFLSLIFLIDFFSSFQCANTLKKDECLQKCPKCDHPAKVRPVQECGVCMNSTCGYHYCSKCRAKYHGSDLCFQVGTKRLTKEIVNTRTAKKYLRRL